MTMRTGPLFALLATGTIALAACGSDNYSSSYNSAAAVPTTSAAAAPTTAASSATTGSGYGNAYAIPTTAAATGTPKAGSGISGTLTTVARPDGTMQLKLGAWPLYRFSGDAAAGDTNGQGTASVWYVVGPDGQPIK